ncbi:MAG TPA: HAD-IC family P-type ATPase [Polyangia bacterium]|nr:HAD-IC family P-type ATPase [Polyangia bacterium]
MPPSDPLLVSPRPETSGLSGDEAGRRLQELGPNSMPDASVHPVRSALGKFWAPVPWMLEIVIVVELVLRDYVEAAVIAVLLIFNAVLSFLQQSHAQATLAALKSRLALTASVHRDGVWKTVPAAALVVGDIVKLSLGAVVAADVHLLEGSVLIDQSMLTGESVPIEGGPGLQTYAGALVRRGEAVAEVTATGIRTKFGRTAELVRTAHVTSTQQKVVFRVVRNLAIFNSGIIVLLASYALLHAMPLREMVPLLLTAVLSSIPVALPATFTLAAAIGAKALAKLGVLPTRLSAIDEAATMDVLCVDKTGTLTQNALTVTAIRVLDGSNEARVLGLAALASSDGGQDSVDAAIRSAASRQSIADLPKLIRFVPFDPASKSSEAEATGVDGVRWRIVKGAFSVVQGLALADPSVASVVSELETKGYRVLALAAGPEKAMRLAGLIALSDPPRADSAGLVRQLRSLGVRTIMVTGDAPVTAGIVAHAVGLDGAVCPSATIPAGLRPDSFGVFAGVLPEDKYRLVQEFQKGGHTVGMCGDGANDAPALRQAQMGIAVSTATDVAKSAAGIVLTVPGLGGIVASVKEGRTIFQRILTYVLKSVTHKFLGALFLLAGILITGHAVLTPLLLVISMITGDFLSMLATTDNVSISQKPSVWNVGHLTIGGICLGVCDLAFCVGVLAVGKYRLGFDLRELQTLSIVTLIFSGQAILYTVRERRHLWSSRPSTWLMAASGADLLVIGTLATRGILMKPLPIAVVAVLLALTVVFCLLLDLVKVRVFRRLQIV